MSTTATTVPAKAALPNEGRPGYKHTKLGWIPMEWAEATIKDTVNKGRHITYGIVKPGDPDEAGVLMIRSQDYANGWCEVGSIMRVSPKIEAPYRRSRVREGDILITVVGANLGKMAVVPDWLDGANISRAAARIGVDPEKANSHFVEQILQSGGVDQLIQLGQIGGAQPVLNLKELGNIRIPLPETWEQRGIAAVLGAWDRAIATAQQLLAAQQERKRGLMQELLTGKRRFPGFGGKWKAVPFDKVFTPKKEVAGEGDYQVLSVTTNGLVSQADYFNRDVASTDRSNYLVVRKGDFVFSGLNFWMGSVDMVWDFDEGIISPAYKCFTINEDQMLLDFARHFIRSHVMLMALVKCSIQGASIVRRNLDKELLEAWPFKLPSLPEQRKIAGALNAVTDTIQALEQELDHLTTQKRGLMQQLLTGAVRVKV